MRFLMNTGVVVVLLCGYALLPVSILYAATLPGQIVPMDAVDSFTATAYSQAKGGAGKILGYAVAVAGLASIPLTHHVGMGLIGGGTGLGIAWLPGMISTTYDSAPAATGVLTTPHLLQGWWVPFLAMGYPFLLMWNLLCNPIVWAMFGMIVVTQRVLISRRHSYVG